MTAPTRLKCDGPEGPQKCWSCEGVGKKVLDDGVAECEICGGHGEVSRIMVRINMPDPSTHYFEHYWKHKNTPRDALMEIFAVMSNGTPLMLEEWDGHEPLVIGPDLLRRCTVTAWDAEKPVPKSLPITDKSFGPEYRWENGFDHHPLSEELMRHCQDVDNAHDDYFDWQTGGDGDNGEVMLHLMDTWFEKRDREK